MREHFKYPRTPHLPWSPGQTDDDKVLKDTSHFLGKEIVATIKMDGECSTLYRNYYHARSVDSKDHPSRHWLKGFHSQVRYHIPEGWRVCGENLFAKHSIKYTELPSYFLVFSVWTDENKCLSWPKTKDFCDDVFHTVTTFQTGPWLPNMEKVLSDKFIGSSKIKFRYPYAEEHEGYVVRLSNVFHFDEFSKSVAKFVRKNHVQTEDHWMFSTIEKNKLF